MRRLKKLILGFAVGLFAAQGFSGVASAAGEVEVLHWWTSGGEAAGLAVIKQEVEKRGVSWKDMPIAGGAGTNAMTVLRARVAAGDPPTAVQLLGFDLVDWSKQGVLNNLNDLAKKNNWDAVVPEAIKKFSKYNGQWVAVPVNVHSTNWVWANKAVFDKLGIKPPTTWSEFEAVVNKMKAAKITPIAHGGQPWQESTVFEMIVLGIDKGQTYKKAFLELDAAALGSTNIQKSFDRLRFVRNNLDPNFSGRDWNLATNMVINGQAGMQMMGDWAKGEFVKAKKVANKDFYCSRFPDTQGFVTFNADQFAMFDIDEKGKAAQQVLAEVIMDKPAQAKFNQFKGSVPARVDISNDGFGDCGVAGMADLRAASQNDTLYGSVAHGYAVPANLKNAIFDVVTAFFNDNYMSSKDAAAQLVRAVENAK